MAISKNIKKEFIFDKRQTNIAKGIAILLLLWHHLFFNNPETYDLFSSFFIIKGIPIESLISTIFKVCVAVFLFLSGYGLYISYNSFTKKVINSKNKYNIKYDFVFVKNHLLKLMSNYWIIYIIFVGMGFFFNRNPIEIYNHNFVYFLIDILGLANIFQIPTMNTTWWFISLIIVLYIIYPLIHKIINWSSECLLLVSFFITIFYFLPDITCIRIYFYPFVFGMYFSKNNLFNKLAHQLDNIIKIIIFSVFSLLITLFMKITIFFRSSEIDGFLSLSIIFVSFFIISRIPIISKLLEVLGKHSGAMFMFHTFIFTYYFEDFFYSFNNPLLIFLVTVIICLMISILISFIKRITCYDKLIKYLTQTKI